MVVHCAQLERAGFDWTLCARPLSSSPVCRAAEDERACRLALASDIREIRSTRACRRPPRDATQRHGLQDRDPSGAASRHPGGARRASTTRDTGRCTVERTRVGADRLSEDRPDRSGRTPTATLRRKHLFAKALRLTAAGRTFVPGRSLVLRDPAGGSAAP
jgi:hypothetical protein